MLMITKLSKISIPTTFPSKSICMPTYVRKRSREKVYANGDATWKMRKGGKRRWSDNTLTKTREILKIAACRTDVPHADARE